MDQNSLYAWVGGWCLTGPAKKNAQCSTLDITEYRARCRTDRAAEYCSLLGPVRHHFTRACSIRLFGSAYQPGVLLGFGARLRFFLQKFTNFVWVLEICIGRHLFPAWGWCPARVVRVLDTLLGTSARRFVRFGCSQDSYLYRPIRFDCSTDYVGYPSLYSVRYSTSKSCRAWNTENASFFFAPRGDSVLI